MSTIKYLKLDDVGEIIYKLFHSYGYKLLVSFILSIISFGFDSTHNKALLAIFILIIIDCLSAIIAAYKTGIVIRSSKFFRTPIKMGIYFGLIYVCRISEFAVPILSGFLDETMIGFIASTELISLMENVHKMGFNVPSQLLKKLINIRDSK